MESLLDNFLLGRAKTGCSFSSVSRRVKHNSALSCKGSSLKKNITYFQ